MFAITHFKFVLSPDEYTHHENLTLTDLRNKFHKVVKVKRPRGYDSMSPAERIISFDELYSIDSKNKGQAIVRGMAEGRGNPALEEAKLIFIDVDAPADKSKPLATPLECHKFLTEKGLNHWIYTSFSHMRTNKTIKYRIVIELDKFITLPYLRENVANVITLLKPMNIFYAGEMNTWSQLWYLPRTPNVGAYEEYLYDDGEMMIPTYDEPDADAAKSRDKSKSKSDDSYNSLADMLTTIRLGTEGLHDAIRNLAYQYVKDGMSVVHATRHLESSMQSSEVIGTPRWQEYYEDIPRACQTAYDKTKENESTDGLDAVSFGSSKAEYKESPMPPGHIGEYLEAIHSTMFMPSREIAFVAGMSVLSTACGAGFNCLAPKPSGVNLAFILVAGTGFGKSQIREFANDVFLSGLEGQIELPEQSCSSFVGSNGYTGQKALHDDLFTARSRLVVLSEAGHTMKSDDAVGDKFVGYTMETLVASSYKDFSVDFSFSDKNNHMTRFRSPNLNLILESTEGKLAELFTNMAALQSGYITRQTVFKVPKRPKRNRSAGIVLPDYACQQLHNILTHSKDFQARPDVEIPLNVNFVTFSDAQLDKLEDWDEEVQERFEADTPASLIATRLLHKVVKYASIATIFNRWTEGKIQVGDKELDWAIAFAEWELSQLDNNLTVAIQGDIYTSISEYLENRMSHLVANKVSPMTDRQAPYGIIPVSVLVKSAKCPELTQLAGMKRCSTRVIIDACLKILAKDNKAKLLPRHSASGTRAECVQIKVRRKAR